ncbi:MAG: hypothetical protein CL666_08820 [Balneola sp.]|nr:hypothetical protein [Balneola sp.]|tara:strand:+ start:5934 stop:7538 length:1605 start_codon:yes stop_codon:yes gene_type:complete
MKLHKKLYAIVIYAVLAVSVTSCDVTGLTDAADDFGVIIGLEEINSGATVLLTDAASGQLIDKQVSIIFAGENGDDVIDFYSDPLSEEKISEGILNFAINNGVVPTPENPAKVTLQLSAPGYISANKTVTLSDTGFVDFSFSLVNENNKPKGVKSTSSSAATNSDGTLSSDLNVSSNTNDGNESETSISIPSGTALTDASGNTLSGSLTAQMTNYDPGDPSALSNLPVEVESENGEPVTLLGMSSYEITDENGRTATGTAGAAKGKAANTQFTIEVAVSSQAGIDVGDNVMFEATDWTNEFSYQQAEIIDLGNGRIGVRVVLNYLPVNTAVYNQLSPVRYRNPNIERNGYEGAVKGVAYSYGMAVGFIYPSNSNTLIGFNSNSSFFELDLSAPVDHIITYPSLPSDPLAITLPQAPSNLIEAEVAVSVDCRDPGEKLAITNISQASLVYRKAGTSGKWRVITEIKWTFDDANNELTGASTTMFGVEEGETYEYTLKIGGEDPYNGEVTITDSNSGKAGVQVFINENDIDSGICS